MRFALRNISIVHPPRDCVSFSFIAFSSAHGYHSFALRSGVLRGCGLGTVRALRSAPSPVRIFDKVRRTAYSVCDHIRTWASLQPRYEWNRRRRAAHFAVRGVVAFHIVIDGYNVIGSEQGLRGDLDAKRSELLHELKGYQARKNYSITVVFDGWRAGRLQQMEQHVGKVQILFSRYGEKADAVIERMARQMGAGCTVVTSDRELRRSVEAAGAVAIYVQEFLEKLRRTGEQEPNNEPGGFDTARTPVQRGQKKGNPRKLSKVERLRRERLKKL